jgi:dihydropyrimidinase
MAYDLLIRGGRAVLPGTDGVPADIAVQRGKIAGILSRGSGAEARETIDASRLVVFPGVVDVHLHLGHGKDIARPRVPEDAAGETAAAAAGGVTTFLPYLMATEPFEDIFDDVRAVTEAGARIDFSYHFIISTEAQLAAVPRYVQMGVPSFKIFMNNRGGEGKRLGLPDIDDGFLFRLCETAAEHGSLVCPHPENIEAAWVLRDRLMAQDPNGKGGLAAWNASRPPFLEADAVQRAGLFARQTGARLYIVHTSSKLALEEGKTCPHYLTYAFDRVAARRRRQDQSAAARARRLRCAVGRHRRGRHRYGGNRSHPPGHREQAGRHLEGVAGLPGDRHAAAGLIERGPP